MKNMNFSRLLKDFGGDMNIYSTGDQHVGNAATTYSGIKKSVSIIKRDKKGVWASGGDQVESIHLTDPRFSVEIHGLHAQLNSQIDYFEELYSPIADKGLYIAPGNHELKVEDIFDPTKELARRLGMRFGGWANVINFGTFKWFDHHGSRSINNYNPDPETHNSLKRKRLRSIMMRLRADCSVMTMHHIHQQIVVKPRGGLAISGEGTGVATYPKMWIGENGEIHPNSRFYGAAGSFLRTQVEGITTYSERAGYNPTELGMLKIEVRDYLPVDIKEIYVG